MKYLSAPQAATVTGVSRQAITRACRRGELPAERHGPPGPRGWWMIKPTDLAAWIKSRPLRGRPRKQK